MGDNIYIPFNKVEVDQNLNQDFEICIKDGCFEGGTFSKFATDELKEITNSKHVLLTSSCTASLEISALLLDLSEGDEIIMPSYTFVSTANAFALRNAKPVFVDIDPYSLCLDVSKIEKCINNRTKAIVVVHYAGLPADIEEVLSIAQKYKLLVIEDAAQCIGSKLDKRHLGTFGDIGCLSFHYTKNVTSGFGGAFLTNNTKLYERAKIALQRGTNRDAFLNGTVDKYSWVNLGSSYVMDELKSVILYRQLKLLDKIQKKRFKIFQVYRDAFEKLEHEGIVKRPFYSNKTVPNGHIFYLLLSIDFDRNHFINSLKKKGIELTSHYEPLHLSEYYLKNHPKHFLPVTEEICSQLVRFPVYPQLSDEQQMYIVNSTLEYFSDSKAQSKKFALSKRLEASHYS